MQIVPQLEKALIRSGSRPVRTFTTRLHAAAELTRLGYTQRALRSITTSFARTRYADPENDDLLTLFYFAGWILVSERRYDQARLRFKMLLTLQQQKSVSERERCRTLYVLAWLCRRLGREAEAQSLYLECLLQAKRLLGANHYVLDLIRAESNRECGDRSAITSGQ